METLASDLQEQGVPQAVTVWDCMAAQWAEPVLHQCWTSQMPCLPIMPDATAYLQSPDTHWNALIKADLRASKSEVQGEGELASMRAGQKYQANWGLLEVAEVLARTAKKFQARNDKDKLMLRAQVENQLTIYRPDAAGVLRDVADQQWTQDARILPEQPSKGIKLRWARARREQRGHWPDGVPPEPDYSRLDASPWLHGPNQERQDQMRALLDEDPEEEATVFDCRVQDFVQDMDPAEAWERRHPDARYADIEIPYPLLNKAFQRRRALNKQGARKHKWAQPGWRKKLQAKYVQLRKTQGASYKEGLLPRHPPKARSL